MHTAEPVIHALGPIGLARMPVKERSQINYYASYAAMVAPIHDYPTLLCARTAGTVRVYVWRMHA